MVVRLSNQRANDSLSHTLSHQSSVTRSPNHWCAISCVTTVTEYSVGLSPGLVSTASANSKIAPQFSMPPKPVLGLLL